MSERVADGFCDKHRPSPAKVYAGCWVCSRDEEMALRHQAELEKIEIFAGACVVTIMLIATSVFCAWLMK